MSASGQRQVLVKMARFSSFTRRTVALSFVLSFPSLAQDGGVSLDAPRVLQLPNGHYDINPPAFVKLDGELKRLQQLERTHNQEPSWATPVLIGMGLGVLAGLAVGVPVGIWAKSALDVGK